MRSIDLYGLGQTMYELVTGYSLNLPTIAGAATTISREQEGNDYCVRSQNFARSLPALRQRYVDAWQQLFIIGIPSDICNAIKILSDPDPRRRCKANLFRLARLLLR
jgi:hypothetical protein